MNKININQSLAKISNINFTEIKKSGIIMTLIELEIKKDLISFYNEEVS